jgi:adenylosuccinate synthase
LNHLEALIITKLDILDSLAEIPVGLAYKYQGRRFTDFPPDAETLEGVQVHYCILPGWLEPTFGLKDFSKLPQKAKDYLRFLSSQVGVEIAMVSTGPERDQALWLEDSHFRSRIC